MANSRITIAERIARGLPFEVRIQVRHPMETGYRADDMGESIPRNVIRTLTCRYNGEPVFVARMSPGIAANPYLRLIFGYPAVAAQAQVAPFAAERFVEAEARDAFLGRLATDGAVRDYPLRIRKTNGAPVMPQVGTAVL